MQQIECFLAAHSGYAYLGSARLMEIAKAANREIKFRPIDLRRTVDASGTVSFRDRQAARIDYFFRRELERWSEDRNVPFLDSYSPQHHSNDVTLANCILIAADHGGLDVGSLAHGMLQAHWRDDADLADVPTLTAIMEELGMESDELLATARSDAVTGEYEANTQEAIRRHVFGSPTYFVDGDMFYGQDRLEMVERALTKPYAGEVTIKG